MTSNKNRILPLSLLVLVLVGIVYYAYRKERGFRVTDSDNDAVATSTKTLEIAPGIFAEVEGNAVPTITVVPVEDSLPMPNLEGPVVTPTAMDTQTGQRIVNHIKNLTVLLRADPSSYNTWNDLGIYRKMLNDYKGAEEIWVYLIDAVPTVATAHINLGNLYAYYIRDNKKAEVHFLKAVELAPRWTEGYIRLVDFYVTVLADETKAIKFLENSIVKYSDMKTYLDPTLNDLLK